MGLGREVIFFAVLPLCCRRTKTYSAMVAFCTPRRARSPSSSVRYTRSHSSSCLRPFSNRHCRCPRRRTPFRSPAHSALCVLSQQQRALHQLALALLASSSAPPVPKNTAVDHSLSLSLSPSLSLQSPHAAGETSNAVPTHHGRAAS
jgi:hypothetical protein